MKSLIFILISILILFNCLLNAQEKEESQGIEVEYLEDPTDPILPFGQGLQAQFLGQFSTLGEEDIRVDSYWAPSIMLRYSLKDQWLFEGQFKNDISWTEISEDTALRTNHIAPINANILFAPDREWGFWVFKTFSFKTINEIPVSKNQHFTSEWDVNWLTEINERIELDYRFGYKFNAEEENNFAYNLEVDFYIGPRVLLEVGNEGEWSSVKDSYDSKLFIDLAFLSKYEKQFNLYTRLGLTDSYSEFGCMLAYNFGKKRKEP